MDGFGKIKQAFPLWVVRRRNVRAGGGWHTTYTAERDGSLCADTSPERLSAKMRAAEAYHGWSRGSAEPAPRVNAP